MTSLFCIALHCIALCSNSLLVQYCRCIEEQKKPIQAIKCDPTQDLSLTNFKAINLMNCLNLFNKNDFSKKAIQLSKCMKLSYFCRVIVKRFIKYNNIDS